MSKNQLSPEIIKSALFDSSCVNADIVAKAIGDNEEYFKMAYNIAFTEAYPMSMRAAHVCQLCCEKYYNLIIPYMDELPLRLQTNKIDGVKRCFLKIIAFYIPEKKFGNIDKLTEVCFNFMTDYSQSIAVRAYSMDVAFKLCQLEPDLQFELEEIARFELESPHPGMQSKAMKVLEKMISKRKSK